MAVRLLRDAGNRSAIVTSPLSGTIVVSKTLFTSYLISLFFIIHLSFLGITLKGENAQEIWDPEHKNEGADGTNEQHFSVDQKLIIKMVCLFCTTFFLLYKNNTIS